MFSAEQLQKLAVEVVSKYVNSGISLNDGIASVAKEQSLNLEQIKRLVESSNQLAYLKLLDSASDRTFEFPVADFETVKGLVTTPGEGVVMDIEKSASQNVDILSIFVETWHEKIAHTEEFCFSDREWLEKSASQGTAYAAAYALREQYLREFGDLDAKLPLHAESLVKSASVLRRDPYIADKVSSLDHPLAKVIEGFFPAELEKSASQGKAVFRPHEMKDLLKFASMVEESGRDLLRHQFLSRELEKLAGIFSNVAKAIATSPKQAIAGVQGLSHATVSHVKSNPVSAGLTALEYGHAVNTIRPAKSLVKGAEELGKEAAASNSASQAISKAWKSGFIGRRADKARQNLGDKWAKSPEGQREHQKLLNSGVHPDVANRQFQDVTAEKGKAAFGERRNLAAESLLTATAINPAHSLWDSLHSTGS